MPYYSELGLTSIPSSSAYSSLFLSGPYSNHSSIIASNFSPPKSIPRQYRGAYKPHLSTITELNAPLRRLNSPKLLYQGTSTTVRPIKKINTADIDVSVNRYKKFDKYDRSKPEIIEKKITEKTPSPVSSPRQSVDEKEQKTAKPNPIRRDRATIRLQTVHKDTLQKEIGEIKSWRDNFKPEELGTEAKRARKTPGEILKEKFLIRSRSKENIPKSESKKISRKNSVKKSSSFHEICEAITSENIDVELNPGQPQDIQRRQSRQISSENIIKQIRRSSTDLSEEDLKILDAILSEQSDMPSVQKVEKAHFESRGSVRKKRKDEEEKSDTPYRIKKSHSKENIDSEPKSPLQRRLVNKRSRKPSIEKEEKSDDLKEEIYQNVIRDISQVEIEQTAFKPKPVITGSGEIGQTKTALKAVVDDVEVQEAARPKKEKKFKFNVIVEVENEDNFERRSGTPEGNKKKKSTKFLPGDKIILTDNERGIVQLPKSKEGVLSSILKKRSPVHKGEVIEEKVKKPMKIPDPVSIPAKENGREYSPVPESPLVNEKNIFNKIISKKENASDSNLFEKKDAKTSNYSLPATSTIKGKTLDNSSAPCSPFGSKRNLFSKENSKEDSRPSSPATLANKINKLDNDSASSSPFGSKRNLFSTLNSKEEDSRPSSPANKITKFDNVSSPSSPFTSQRNLLSKENSKEEDSRPSTPTDKIKKLENVSAPSSPFGSKTKFIKEECNKKEYSRPSSPSGLVNRRKNLENASTPTSPLASQINVFSRTNSNKEDITDSTPNTPKLLNDVSTTSNLAGKPIVSSDSITEDSRPLTPTKVEKVSHPLSPLSPLSSGKDTDHKNTSKQPVYSSPNASTNKMDTSSPPSPLASKNNLLGKNKKEQTESSSPLVKTGGFEKFEINSSSNASTDKTKVMNDIVTNRSKTTKEETPPASPLAKKGNFKKFDIPTKNKSETTSVPTKKQTDEEKTVSKEQIKEKYIPATPTVTRSKNILDKSEEIQNKSENIKDEAVEKDIEEPRQVEKDENDNTIINETKEQSEAAKKLVSKRSLVQKANKDDPDLVVFVPPEPEPEPEPVVEENKDVFVPLQSNRLTQWMHPWKKPEQFDVCPVEIFARPKVIRGRHYPRPRGQPAPAPAPESSSEDEDDEDDDESEEDTSSEEETTEDECEEGTATKIGASTSSNDSGFGSGAPGKNKDCDVNIHKKCEKLTANLCGVNQKLVVEAIESVRKGSLESRDSPTTNHANNPAFALDSDDVPEEYSQSSTYTSFQKSGRITPPATTIPRFRKYCIDDFNFLKVLGKGSFGKVLLAELKGTEYYYAVKCLKKDVVLEDDDVECTLIERKVLALGTKHPYLCHLLCTFQTESHLFFVMEYLNGGDLMFHIQASGRFPEHQARFYGAEIVSGLKFLHSKGIVYRDLKLDNVLLDFDGHVRIADFGMCKLQIFLDRMAETFCGTPDYMAPEIIKGQHYNQCVDWWSFGVLLYEMLLGQSPFSGCDEDELFWSICNEKPVLPRYLSAEATNILTLFLEKDASKRLGNRFCPHGDIQDQPFFKPIDWRALEARQLEPPFKPTLHHPLDTQYFDKHFTVEKAKLTPIESTILQSMDQTQFQGFSYTNPNATDK